MKTVRLTRPGSNPVRDSDRRIADAIQTLEHHRGRQVLQDLARLFKGPASGLDLTGMSALVCLVREFAMGSRREFLPAIHADKAFTIREQDTTGDAFVLGFDGEKVVYTSHVEFAKQFSQAQAERFIDKYQGAGYGLEVAMIEEAK